MSKNSRRQKRLAQTVSCKEGVSEGARWLVEGGRGRKVWQVKCSQAAAAAAAAFNVCEIEKFTL